MNTKNAMQLKAFIKQKATEKHISAQLVMQNYMLERLLERISISPYKYNFIIKGGFLVSNIVGLDTRATMDLDTTVKGFTLNNENILLVFKNLCDISLGDDINFEVVDIVDIRQKDDYPGIRVSLKAIYDPICVPLTVDITTGDIITPCEIQYTFKTLFENRSIDILSYNLETILAEKLETILSRNIANTRMRDYYDVYILYSLRGEQCNKSTMKSALERTAKKRGSSNNIIQYKTIMKDIRKSEILRKQWSKYRNDYDYAKDISFDNACDIVEKIMHEIIN